MSRRASRTSLSDGEFMLECKAAYLSVYDDVKDEIKSRDELVEVLQQAGRNPTSRVLSKYWKSDTEELSYDDFVDICRKEPVTTTDDLMKAFRKIDINGDGYISLDELFKLMTTKGEKMSRSEVKKMIDEVDENRDGKLDYGEFCKMIMNTTDECKKMARKVMERKERKKRAQMETQKRGEGSLLGSQTSLRSSASQRSPAERPMSASARSTASAKKEGEDKKDEGVETAESELIKISASRTSLVSNKSLKKRSSVDDPVELSSKANISSSASKTSLKSDKVMQENAVTEEKTEDKDDLRASRASLKSNKSVLSRKSHKEQDEAADTKAISASRASLRSNKSTTADVNTTADNKSPEEETKIEEDVKASRASLRSSKSVSSRKSNQEQEVAEEVAETKAISASRASLRSNKSGTADAITTADIIAPEEEPKTEQDIKASRASLRSNKSVSSRKVAEEAPAKEDVSASRASIRSTKSTKSNQEAEPSGKLLSSRASIKSGKNLLARITETAPEEGSKEEASKPEGGDGNTDSDDTDSDIVVGTPRPSARSERELDRLSAHRYSLQSLGEKPATPTKRTTGMSNSRRSLLSVGDKDLVTPVPAQRKSILSRLEMDEDDLPRPSPRTNKSKVKGEPAGRLHLAEPKNLKEWTHSSSKGMFFIDEDNGSLMSHQYTLRITETTKVWFTIEPSSCKSLIHMDGPVDTALFILRSRADSSGNVLAGFTDHRDGKGKYGARCELSPGTYHLIPFTTGCRLKKRTEEPSKSKALLQEKSGSYTLSKAFKKALEDIFDMCDLDGNGLISREEFNLYNLRTSDEEVGDEEWEVVEERLELENGEITKNGFIQLNELEAEDSNGDEDDMWVTLESMGFSKELVMDQACPFKLNVYTEDCDDAVLKVSGIELMEEKLDKALCQSIIERSEPTKIKGMKDLFLYTYYGDARASILIDNKSYSSVKLELDCEGSTNCLTNQETLNESFSVKANSQMIAFHFIPDDESSSWSCSCKETILK